MATLATTACTCRSVEILDQEFDEAQARTLIPALNSHLGHLRRLLAKSKALSHAVQYHITPRHQRTIKALSVGSVDLQPINELQQQFGEKLGEFWTVSAKNVNAELRRRLACVVVFLSSKLDTQAIVPPQLAYLFPGKHCYSDIRNSGRKYIQIAQKLRDLGAILWLPLEIPPSTYERYISLDDEDIFSHLISLAPHLEQYTGFVKRLILHQLRETTLLPSYYNLVVDYADLIGGSDQLLLLLHVLGGKAIPEMLLTNVSFPQRRWNKEGEVENVSIYEIGLPNELVKLLLDPAALSRARTSPYIIKETLDDATSTLSLCPGLSSRLTRVLLPRTINEYGITAVKLLCFVCQPCYEGNIDWSPSQKEYIWPIIEKAITTYKVPTALREQVLEVTLFFAERDWVGIRHAAVNRAQALLRKSMPYYLLASVVLFRSTLYRIDGEFAKSEAHVREFMWRGPHPSTRRDHALQGRLHISQVENKIRCFDNNVPSLMYEWTSKSPISTLELEVTFRLQSTVARFFQSVGDFSAAKASLEQILSLNQAKPIRGNTRRVLAGRLADLYCEMEEYGKAMEMLQSEFHSIDKAARARRPFRRLLLASVDASIGMQRFNAAGQALEELKYAEPLGLDNLHDQQLHMRAFISKARMAHVEADLDKAVLLWKVALHEVQRMHTLGSGYGFTAALIQLSLAHAQLATGDHINGARSWAAGSEILRSQICEFWLPVVPTAWLQRIVRDVHESHGWFLRMMLPGSKSDIVLP
ncbi:LipA and NB-ARC domain-containing protein [Colletotrichum truncatum]|uniref:LipA and NB-ARC domain-containing protein n=1 Tax=Colletotrichum truncatum TaxID=5467 RepID=A0ACC3ZG62_COLTU|nr:LipA and NB-ARC domain-containing protein [Colletotrichum truncatum]KAF6802015.1 LipA and NB-ARC domain-containing protein [Colletotrichum truncatum]